MTSNNYWGFRIDRNRYELLNREMQAGRLRQGWGWDKRQDLDDLQMDEGAKRNLTIRSKVKKGDLVLVPHLPEPGKVSIVEATEDWDDAYRFEPLNYTEKSGKTSCDYGHIFPVRHLKTFDKNNEHVQSNLTSTLKAQQRFWNINHCSDAVDLLLEATDVLMDPRDKTLILQNIASKAWTAAFQDDLFNDTMFEEATKSLNASQWERPLAEGLERLYPQYTIEHVGNRNEEEHGSDLFIRIPNPFSDLDYVIAVQIKDYEGPVDPNKLNQLKKSKSYFETIGEGKLIDMWFVITRCDKKDNEALEKASEDINVMYINEFKSLLKQIGLTLSEESIRENRA